MAPAQRLIAAGNMSPVDVLPRGGLLAHRVCYRLAGRAEGLAALAEIQNDSGLP
jgi:hypothetical protein